MKKPFVLKTTSGAQRAGFTLIELLTVIAIIAILAGMTAVAIPQYLQKAHTTKAIANMDNVAKAITAKSAEAGNTGGYPPAYGFVRPEARDVDRATLLGPPPAVDDSYYVTKPYTITVGIHAVDNVYEIPNWNLTGYDSNGDGILGLLEFSAVGEKAVSGNTYTFSTELYSGPNGEFTGASGSADPLTPGGISELSLQSESGALRPFVYVPFNKRQLAAVRRYWLEPSSSGYEPNGYGESIDISDPELAGRLFFPAAQYDGFVLIGVGPGGTNGGVVADPPAGSDPAYAYHYAALRTAFLATRDMDPDGAGPAKSDGLLDFDFQARKDATDINILPDGTNGYGAFIKVVE